MAGWSGTQEFFLPLSETASRNPCVRACGQRSSSCSSTVIAARLPVSRRVVHAAPRRFVPAAVPRVSIFIVALSLAEPNARPAPSESTRADCWQLAQFPHPCIVTSLQSFIARPTPRPLRFMVSDFRDGTSSIL